MSSSQAGLTQESKKAVSGSTDEESGEDSEDSEAEVISTLLTPKKQSQKQPTPPENDDGEKATEGEGESGEGEGDSTIKEKETTPVQRSSTRFIPGIEAPTPERTPQKERTPVAQEEEELPVEQEQEEEEEDVPVTRTKQQKKTANSSRKPSSFEIVIPTKRTPNVTKSGTKGKGKGKGKGKAKRTPEEELFRADEEEELAGHETDYNEPIGRPPTQTSKKARAKNKGKGKQVVVEDEEELEDQSASGANGANGTRGPVASTSSRPKKGRPKKTVKQNPKWKSNEMVDSEEDQDADDEDQPPVTQDSDHGMRPQEEERRAEDPNPSPQGGRSLTPSSAPSHHSDNQRDPLGDHDMQVSDQHGGGGDQEEDESYAPSKKRRKSSSKRRSKSRSRPAPPTTHSHSPAPDDSFPRKKFRHRRRSPSATPPLNPKTSQATQRQASANQFNHWEPSDNPDRANNPDREQSFTRWSSRRGKFVPDKIWLHSMDGSSISYTSQYDSFEKRKILGDKYGREEVRELVERNGGIVVDADDMRDARIVVLPDGLWGNEVYAELYREGRILGKDLVRVSWIIESIYRQDECPCYRSNHLQAAHQPAAPKAPVAVQYSQNDEGKIIERGRVYDVKNEEENYWKKLARACEIGGGDHEDEMESNMMKRSDMYSEMENRFYPRYRRTRVDYREMYPQFLRRLKEQKQRRYPARVAPKLEEIELWTSEEEEEVREWRRVKREKKERRKRKVSEMQVDREEEENERSAKKPVKKKDSLFIPKKPKARLEEEARMEEEARLASEEREEVKRREREETVRREEEDDSFDLSNPDLELIPSLARKYPRFESIIFCLFFHSNCNSTRTRRLLKNLTRLKAYRKERDDVKAGTLAENIKRDLFSYDEDNKLLRIPDHLNGDDVVRTREWQFLTNQQQWSERELWKRLDILRMSGQAWSRELGDKGKRNRESEWIRLNEVLTT